MWQLVLNYASGTDVSAFVVGGMTVVYFDSRARGMHKLELAGGRVDVGDNADMAYGAR